METIKKLEEAAKNCLSDLKSIESKISVSEGRLDFLNAAKIKLAAEVSEMEAKKTAILESTTRAEMESKRGIEDRLAALKLKEENIQNEMANWKIKSFQAESERSEAQEARLKYEKLYVDYMARYEELNQKKLAVADILK